MADKSQAINPKFALNFKTISPLHFSWKGQTLWLSERRCIFWEEEKMLILSDPHFGKTGHFRKSGIQVTQKVFQADLHAFFELIQFFKPEKVLITGDLFHSSHNKEIDWFIDWRNNFRNLQVILVRGNHDILNDEVYATAGIKVIENSWSIKPFCFTHDIASLSSDQYIFSGHLHPSVRISGPGKQALRLPCFYFGKDHAILPAFGKFTGNASIQPKKNDKVFGITNHEIILLQ